VAVDRRVQQTVYGPSCPICRPTSRDKIVVVCVVRQMILIIDDSTRTCTDERTIVMVRTHMHLGKSSSVRKIWVTLILGEITLHLHTSNDKEVVTQALVPGQVGYTYVYVIISMPIC
jgi:hypothetical protein